jgi:hypothetical protein
VDGTVPGVLHAPLHAAEQVEHQRLSHHAVPLRGTALHCLLDRLERLHAAGLVEQVRIGSMDTDYLHDQGARPSEHPSGLTKEVHRFQQ